MEIRVMARRGEAVRAIARQLDCSRNTVRRYLRDEAACRYGPRRRARASSTSTGATCTSARASPPALDTGDGSSARDRRTRLRRRNQPDEGVAGAAEEERARARRGFETPPGKQMQADFTHVRRGRDPLIALVATMGYSRATFVKFTTGEDAATLCAGLREAFDYFGGVPEHVLFDNAKAVVIERDAYGPGLHRWNDEMKALAEACGFTPRCAARTGPGQGQGQRFNSYLKGSFVVPLAATLEASGLRLGVDLANAHVRRWLDEIANDRVHGTTKAVPAVRLAESGR